MDNRIFDENNGLWYEKQGDYLIPCLTLPPEKEQPIRLIRTAALAVLKGTPQDYIHKSAHKRQVKHLHLRY